MIEIVTSWSKGSRKLIFQGYLFTKHIDDSDGKEIGCLNVVIIPFCPHNILSIPFCLYHFVRYHFVLELVHPVHRSVHSYTDSNRSFSLGYVIPETFRLAEVKPIVKKSSHGPVVSVPIGRSRIFFSFLICGRTISCRNINLPIDVTIRQKRPLHGRRFPHHWGAWLLSLFTDTRTIYKFTITVSYLIHISSMVDSSSASTSGCWRIASSWMHRRPSSSVRLSQSLPWLHYHSIRSLWMEIPPSSHSRSAIWASSSIQPYLADYSVPVGAIEGQSSLRSAAAGRLCVPRTNTVTIGLRAFTVFSSTAWNNLPADLRDQGPDSQNFRKNLSFT